jgi:phage terminase small subunit
MALSVKEISFIDHYFDNGFNATEAILSVNNKIKRESARTEGWRMLMRVDVRDEIDRRMSDYRAKRRMTVEQVGDLIQDFAQVDVLDIFTEDGDLKPLSEMSPAARRCIGSIEVEERYDQTWDDKEDDFKPTLVKTKKIKLVDKKGAAELLGKYKKMFTDKVDVTSDGKALAVNIVINGQKKG